MILCGFLHFSATVRSAARICMHEPPFLISIGIRFFLNYENQIITEIKLSRLMNVPIKIKYQLKNFTSYWSKNHFHF